MVVLETMSTFLDCDLFSVKVRCVTTDSASSNVKVERSIPEARLEAWITLHVSCIFHTISICHKMLFDFTKTQISAMINLTFAVSTIVAAIDLR